MSGLTPEAARAAAEWLARNVMSIAQVRALRAEADRLEDAAKTPGQALAGAERKAWNGMSAESQKNADYRAAAVIAHHVGPDRVVVNRDDGEKIQRILVGIRGTERLCTRLREALS